MDPDQLVTDYEHEVAAIAAKAEEAKEQIKNLAGSATSSEGAVTVSVSGGGALQDLQFGPRADEMPRAQLAALVLATARKAQARASQQILAIMGDLVGENSDAMRFVQEQIPSPEEPDDDEPPSEPGHGYSFEAEAGSDPEPPTTPPVPPTPAAQVRRPRPLRPDFDEDDYDQSSPLPREERW